MTPTALALLFCLVIAVIHISDGLTVGPMLRASSPETCLFLAGGDGDQAREIHLRGARCVQCRRSLCTRSQHPVWLCAQVSPSLWLMPRLLGSTGGLDEFFAPYLWQVLCSCQCSISLSVFHLFAVVVCSFCNVPDPEHVLETGSSGDIGACVEPGAHCVVQRLIRAASGAPCLSDAM